MARGDDLKARALTFSAEGLAAIFAVHRTTVHEWCRAGMPGPVGGQFNLAACVQWRQQELKDLPPSGELATERRLLLIEQARGHAIANEQKATSLLPREDVLADIQAYGTIVATQLDRLVDRATAAVAAAPRDPAAVRVALRDACREARVALAKAFAAHGAGLADEAPARRVNGANHGD